jgi:hypothetical protein
MIAKAIKTAVRSCKTKFHIVPQPMTSVPLILCDLPEWLVLPPHGNTDFHALAAFFSQRAHAARKSNSHNELILLQTLVDLKCHH